MISSDASIRLYVFAPLPSGERIAAGVITGDGRFRYGGNWLKHKAAYPLDPINLPLSGEMFYASNRSGIFPVFSDAGPDRWGMNILTRIKGREPINELERLLLTNGLGVGSLRFSLSRNKIKESPALPEMADLSQIEQISNRIAAGEDVAPADLALLYPGSSMGGARPKITAKRENNNASIIKFRQHTDPMNIAKVEAICMQLAAKAGIRVPDNSYIELHHGAFSIDRFDRGDEPVHYLSAHALFNSERFSTRPGRLWHSYPNFASMIATFSSNPRRDTSELYTRMAFNVFIGNTDDHGRNHGVIYQPASGEWALSPAFDIVTIVGGGDHHAIGLGTEGRCPTLSNLLSCHSDFRLSREEAIAILSNTLKVAKSWGELASVVGLSSNDSRLLNSILTPIHARYKALETS